MKMKVLCDDKGIKVAAKTVQQGGIVVFPTDTVYGVGCDPYNEEAISLIYKFKKRTKSKPLPVLGYSSKELSKIAVFNEKARKLADKFWPGGLTLVLSVKDEKIKKSLHLVDKIAVRVPNSECALSLLKKCKLLVGTSANISGNPPFTDPQLCAQNTSGYDVLIDGGKITSKGESTILEINKELKVLREGVIPTKTIMSIF